MVFNTGNIPWNKGKKGAQTHSEESKRKMSLLRKGKKKSEQWKHNMAISKIGSKNPMWKGDEVGYGKLHGWVRSRLPKPDICTCCEEKPTLDLANYTGIYNRDLDNWIYLCRSCHMKLDYATGDRIHW